MFHTQQTLVLHSFSLVHISCNSHNYLPHCVQIKSALILTWIFFMCYVILYSPWGQLLSE